MSFWRREHVHDGEVKVIYHCDEHNYHSSDAAEIEQHSLLHGKRPAGFWRRSKGPDSEQTVFSCEEHKFSSSNPMEIEEHERLHAMETGISR